MGSTRYWPVERRPISSNDPIHPLYKFSFVFPAKAGTQSCHGHRPSPFAEAKEGLPPFRGPRSLTAKCHVGRGPTGHNRSDDGRKAREKEHARDAPGRRHGRALIRSGERTLGRHPKGVGLFNRGRFELFRERDSRAGSARARCEKPLRRVCTHANIDATSAEAGFRSGFPWPSMRVRAEDRSLHAARAC
jgi:hypothetical protein